VATADHQNIAHCIDTLTAIRDEMVAAAQSHPASLESLDPDRRHSAHNLLHYLSLRRHDLRSLQQELAALGLSSLGRAESHVLATVDAVLAALHAMDGRAWTPLESAAGFERGAGLLAAQTERLLGPPSPVRGVRIMVTMPTEAAEDESLVHDLVRSGMNCMRINCAHDDKERWMRMIAHLRQTETALDATCKVMIDLSGPKPRTGPIVPGPAVIKIRPHRDPFGRVTMPARVWLTDCAAPQSPPSHADAVLPVARSWLDRLTAGDRVTFRDTRDAKRRFRIMDVAGAGAWAELKRTAYVVPGTTLRLSTDSNDGDPIESIVDELTPRESFLTLAPGDTLILTRDLSPGRPASRDRCGSVLTPASIGCSLPHVFDQVRSGDAIWFDDGRIGGVIDRSDRNHLTVRITHGPSAGARLRSGKGINLPDTNLRVPAVTDQDLENLASLAGHADIVALSFVSSASDLEALQTHLSKLRMRPPSIVLKIETRRGFEQLPDILMAAMKLPCAGIMIARGDLAVECGFERLAEVQEEILWICEAAHIPVIWATEVLDTLARKGLRSRAEITDAAMGHRAECVMLNKGPFIVTAVRTLDDILTRMQAHQTKKQSMLRELRLAYAPLAPPLSQSR
jgi:pyruvate kinase